jgi:hypothetical protein
MKPKVSDGFIKPNEASEGLVMLYQSLYGDIRPYGTY